MDNSKNIPPANWENKLQKLKKFISDHDRLPIQRNDEAGLGYWMASQKRAYYKGKLSDYKVRELSVLKHWRWKATPSNKIKWEDRFTRLQNFVDVLGRFPHYNGDEDGLGLWMNNQKILYYKGKLLPYRAILLETIPDWSWFGDNTNAWEENYEILREFIITNDRLPDRNNNEGGIGFWLGYQAEKCRGNDIEYEKLDLLRRLNVCGSSARGGNECWEIKYERLKNFIIKNNRLPVQSDRDVDITWILGVIDQYRKNRLTEGRIMSIEALPLWDWGHAIRTSRRSVKETRCWDYMYIVLSEFVSSRNRFPTHRDRDGNCINRWIQRQNKNYGLGILSDEKIQKLEKISMWEWKVPNPKLLNSAVHHLFPIKINIDRDSKMALIINSFEISNKKKRRAPDDIHDGLTKKIKIEDTDFYFQPDGLSDISQFFADSETEESL